MIIGLTGYKQAGKDSTADVLVKRLGFVKLAFADTLRKMALDIDPYIKVNAHDVFERYGILLGQDGYEECKNIPDFRGFLQKLGTEGVRKHLGDNVWVDALDKVVASSPNLNYVITDCRFPNEVEWIKQRGQLWKITRLGQVNDDVHESERHIKSFEADYHIIAGSLAELQEKAFLAYVGEVK